MPSEAGKAPKSFVDCLTNILGELGKAEAYPDADPAVIQGLRDQILPVVKPPAMEDPMAAMGAGGDPMAAAMGAGQEPVPTQEAMGRLPRPSLAGGENAREMAADLERQLSGI